MKITVCLFAAALALLLAGCAHSPAMGGGGGTELTNYAESPSTPPAAWQPQDYRWTLQDPGPF
jgi:hypothetical protein